jgi:hypothetical protein
MALEDWLLSLNEISDLEGKLKELNDDDVKDLFLGLLKHIANVGTDLAAIEREFGVIFSDNIDEVLAAVLSEYETRIISKNEEDVWAYVNNNALDKLRPSVLAKIRDTLPLDIKGLVEPDYDKTIDSLIQEKIILKSLEILTTKTKTTIEGWKEILSKPYKLTESNLIDLFSMVKNAYVAKDFIDICGEDFLDGLPKDDRVVNEYTKLNSIIELENSKDLFTVVAPLSKSMGNAEFSQKLIKMMPFTKDNLFDIMELIINFEKEKSNTTPGYQLNHVLGKFLTLLTENNIQSLRDSPEKNDKFISLIFKACYQVRTLEPFPASDEKDIIKKTIVELGELAAKNVPEAVKTMNLEENNEDGLSVAQNYASLMKKKDDFLSQSIENINKGDINIDNFAILFSLASDIQLSKTLSNFCREKSISSWQACLNDIYLYGTEEVRSVLFSDDLVEKLNTPGDPAHRYTKKSQFIGNKLRADDLNNLRSDIRKESIAGADVGKAGAAAILLESPNENSDKDNFKFHDVYLDKASQTFSESNPLHKSFDRSSSISARIKRIYKDSIGVDDIDEKSIKAARSSNNSVAQKICSVECIARLYEKSPEVCKEAFQDESMQKILSQVIDNSRSGYAREGVIHKRLGADSMFMLTKGQEYKAKFNQLKELKNELAPQENIHPNIPKK